MLYDVITILSDLYCLVCCSQEFLRLPNGSFILIDFENSGRDGDIIPAELTVSRVMDPEVVANHKYTRAHDMYQVGKLIEESLRDPPQEVLQLRNELLRPSGERYSAAEALKFLESLTSPE